MRNAEFLLASRKRERPETRHDRRRLAMGDSVEHELQNMHVDKLVEFSTHFFQRADAHEA